MFRCDKPLKVFCVICFMCMWTMIIISTNMVAQGKGKIRADGCSPWFEGHVPFAWKKGNTLWPYPSLALNTTLIWKEHAERTLWMEGLHYLKLVLHSKYFCESHSSSLLVKKLLSLRPLHWKWKSVAGWSLLQGNVASSYIHPMTAKKLLDNLPLPPALLGSMSYFHG